jgi:hypothetical protein
MDEFKHLSVKDKKNITTVVLYLGAVVEIQDYSLAGEVAVVSALKSLDEKVSSHLYEKYRDDIPTLLLSKWLLVVLLISNAGEARRRKCVCFPGSASIKALFCIDARCTRQYDAFLVDGPPISLGS